MRYEKENIEMRMQMIQLFTCGMRCGRAIIEHDIDTEDDIFYGIFHTPDDEPTTPEEIMKKAMSFVEQFSLTTERKECRKVQSKMYSMEKFIEGAESIARNLQYQLDHVEK